MGSPAKAGITVALVGAGIGYMVLTTVSGGEVLEYYKHVDELLRDPAGWRGKRLQLHGHVVRGSVVKKPGSLDFRFALHRGGEWIDVAYSGLVPDSFKDCGEVVVKGKLTTDRAFAADAISAKCPSKYDGKRQAGVCGEAHLAEVLGQRARGQGRGAPTR